ncbi:MAG: hypothetical protein ACO3FE_18060, partial [Planctomycetaceae bacterium]
VGADRRYTLSNHRLNAIAYAARFVWRALDRVAECIFPQQTCLLSVPSAALSAALEVRCKRIWRMHRNNPHASLRLLW